MLIDGLHVPLATPFSRDGRLFLSRLESNVRRYSLSPAAALVAFSPRSEATSLSDAEVRDSLDVIGGAAAAEKVLVAGVVRNSVAQALTVIALAERAHFDVAMVAAPPAWPQMVRQAGSPEPVLNYFRIVADNSPLPIMLWSDSATPWLGFSVDTVARLVEHPNILGVYDADLSAARLAEMQARTSGKVVEATVTATFRPVTRRMLQVAATRSTHDGMVSAESLTRQGNGAAAAAAGSSAGVLKTRTRRLRFQIISTGPGSRALDWLQAGVAGFMPSLATAAPQVCHEVLAAFQDGNPALAAERAFRLADADRLLAKLGAPGVAVAADLNGYYGGLPRLPLLPLTADQRADLLAAMRDLRH